MLTSIIITGAVIYTVLNITFISTLLIWTLASTLLIWLLVSTLLWDICGIWGRWKMNGVGSTAEARERKISFYLFWWKKKGADSVSRGIKFHLLDENLKMWHKASIRYSGESKSPRAALLNFSRDFLFFFHFLFFLFSPHLSDSLYYFSETIGNRMAHR